MAPRPRYARSADTTSVDTSGEGRGASPPVTPEYGHLHASGDEEDGNGEYRGPVRDGMNATTTRDHTSTYTQRRRASLHMAERLAERSESAPPGVLPTTAHRQQRRRSTSGGGDISTGRRPSVGRQSSGNLSVEERRSSLGGRQSSINEAAEGEEFRSRRRNSGVYILEEPVQSTSWSHQSEPTHQLLQPQQPETTDQNPAETVLPTVAPPPTEPVTRAISLDAENLRRSLSSDQSIFDTVAAAIGLDVELETAPTRRRSSLLRTSRSSPSAPLSINRTIRDIMNPGTDPNGRATATSQAEHRAPNQTAALIPTHDYEEEVRFDDVETESRPRLQRRPRRRHTTAGRRPVLQNFFDRLTNLETEVSTPDESAPPVGVSDPASHREFDSRRTSVANDRRLSALLTPSGTDFSEENESDEGQSNDEQTVQDDMRIFIPNEADPQGEQDFFNSDVFEMVDGLITLVEPMDNGKERHPFLEARNRLGALLTTD